MPIKEENFMDKTITCRDCGVEFVFTEGEQAFYAEKGFTNEPVRCADCRRARKAQRQNWSQIVDSSKNLWYTIDITSGKKRPNHV